MIGFFDNPTVKTVAGFLFAGVVGFAIGNGHATGDALSGQAQWFQRDCHAKIVAHVEATHSQDVQTLEGN